MGGRPGSRRLDWRAGDNYDVCPTAVGRRLDKSNESATLARDVHKASDVAIYSGRAGSPSFSTSTATHHAAMDVCDSDARKENNLRPKPLDSNYTR